MRYRIWCHERDMWWCPNSIGYTNLIEDSGLYSEEEAMDICLRANGRFHNPEESMVPALEDSSYA